MKHAGLAGFPCPRFTEVPGVKALSSTTGEDFRFGYQYGN
jgi:hypothetical protein